MAPVVAAVRIIAVAAIASRPMRGRKCSRQMRTTISLVEYSTSSSSALLVMVLTSLNS